MLNKFPMKPYEVNELDLHSIDLLHRDTCMTNLNMRFFIIIVKREKIH
jgi:hypothetical protein